MRPGHKPRLSDPLWGLLTVVVLGVFSYLVFFGVPIGGGFEVRAVVKNAPEIQPGSKVRIAGVNVGQVSGTEKGLRPGLSVVTLELEDSALPLHRDATLKVRPRTFLEGGMFVDLRPGTPSAPELEEGEVIPVSSTAVPVLLGHATADLRYATRQNLRLLFRAARQSLEGGGAEAFHRAQKHVAPAFRGLAQISEASQGRRRGDLSGAVDAGGRTLAALAQRDELLADLQIGRAHV
jgi:phospholipid/cholesterol/gamma-HCH transport system substrate-binding protein